MKHPLTPGLEELHEFNEWLRTQQHRHRIVLGGNHDQTLEDIGQTKASTILNCATLLVRISYLCIPFPVINICTLFVFPEQ